MEFLTKDQIEQLSYKQAQKLLKELKNEYDLATPLTEADFFQRVWPLLDQITTTLLYLEEHIARFENPQFQTYSIEAGVKQEPKAYVPKGRPVKPLRQFKTPQGIFNSIEEAARITGMKVETLNAYIYRKARGEYCFVNQETTAAETQD